jgi:phosphatidylglycerophosphate synthase
MKRAGILVFADSQDGADLADRRFGGLTTLERGIRTMARAGVQRLLVVVPDQVQPALGKVTEKLALDLQFARWGQQPEMNFADNERILILLGDHVHHHTSLRAFVDTDDDGCVLLAQVSSAPPQPPPFHHIPGTDVQDGDSGAVDVSTGALMCCGKLAPEKIVELRQSPLEFLSVLGTPFSLRQGDPNLWRRVHDRASARQARAMLFGQVTKKTSGPVSRHINARISIPISKMLIETGISPHMVTVLFVLTTGLTTAWLISQQPLTYWRLALAGAFWQMAAVLDRCDGEIARVKLCESKFGAWFDTVTDNIAYLATYVAFLMGVQHLHPDKPWALYFGISAIGAMIVALAVMYNYALKTGSGSLQNYLVGFRSHVPADEKNSIYRLLERYAFIAKRDFFAFVHFVCCLLGSFELLYAYTVGGLHLVVLAVLISQRKMLEGHKRQLASDASGTASGTTG